MTPEDLIRELNGFEKGLFRKLYAGKMAGKLYKLYEFRKKE
jgi:phage-related protein